MPMKITINEATEEISSWKLSAQKLPDNNIQLTIGNHDDEANIVVDQSELVKMINILIDLK